MAFGVPLQLVGPELAGVEFRRGVGDILQHGVGEGQPGQDTLRPVNEWSIKDLQDEGQLQLLRRTPASVKLFITMGQLTIN